MSVIISCVFDSFDEAEYVSIKLKRSMPGIRVLGVSRNDGEEKQERIAVPAYSYISAASYPFYGYGNGMFYPYGVIDIHVHDGIESEVDLRRDVRLKIEVYDKETARRATKYLTGVGAREIRQKDTKDTQD